MIFPAIALLAVSFILPSKTVNLPGDFPVPVQIERTASEKITHFEFDLNYNSDAINPAGDCTTAAPGLRLNCRWYEDGTFHVEGDGPIPASGELLSIPFRTYGQAENGDTSGLYITNLLADDGENEADADSSSGYITLKAPRIR